MTYRHSIRSPLVMPFLVVILAACGGSDAQRRQGSEIEIRPVVPSNATGPQAGQETPPAGSPAQAAVVDDRQALAAIEAAGESMRLGRFERARRELEPLLAGGDYTGIAEYNLGVLSQLTGEMNEAARHYQRALEIDASMAPALTSLVRIKLYEGDVDGAQLAYQRSLAASGNATAVRAAGLLIRLERQEYERAIQEARDILIEDEGNIEAHLVLALAYHHLHQPELAGFVLQTAMGRAPERADLWLVQAQIQIEEGNETSAMASLREALELEPHAADAHNNLGVLLHGARRDDEAIEHLERAIELRPDYVEAHLNLSNSQKAVGDLTGAQRSIERALAIDPSFARAYYNLGLLYLDTDFPGLSVIERLQAAVEALTRYRSEMGVALDRDDPVVSYIAEARARIDAERQLQQEVLPSTPQEEDEELWEDETVPGPSGETDIPAGEEDFVPEDEEPMEEEWETY